MFGQASRWFEASRKGNPMEQDKNLYWHLAWWSAICLVLMWFTVRQAIGG
jgi:hypothetical protein